MQARTIHIVRNIVFLIAIAWLAAHVRRPYDDLDGYFTEAVDNIGLSYQLQVQRNIDRIEYEARPPWMYERLKPYLERIYRIDSVTKYVLATLTTDNITVYNADSMQKIYFSYIDYILGCVPQDSVQFRPFIDNAGNVLGRLMKKDEGWMKYIAKLPTSKKKLMVSLLHSSLISSQAMVSKQLVQLSRPGCILRYDTIGAIPLFNSMDVSIGQEAKADIILAALSHYNSEVKFYYKDTLLAAGEHVGHWVKIAGFPGEYDITGYCVTNNYYAEHGDTLPWTFKCRVVDRGISLIHSANQLLYRNYPNPITVSIPGYAPEQVRLWAKNATIVNIDAGKWTITPGKNCADSVVVFADATDVRGHTMCVHSVVCSVVDLPSPSVLLCGRGDGMLTIRAVMDDPMLTASYASDRELKYSVVSFSVIVIDELGSDKGTYAINGSKVTGNKDLEQLLGTLKPGAHLYFTDCKVKTQAGIVVEGMPLGIELY